MERTVDSNFILSHLLAEHEQLRQVSALVTNALNSSRSTIDALQDAASSAPNSPPWSPPSTWQRLDSEEAPPDAWSDHKSADRLLLESLNRPGFRCSGSGYLDESIQARPNIRYASADDVACVTPASLGDTDLMAKARKRALYRLHARLGKETFHGNLTSEQVFNCLLALGLTRYEECDIDEWLRQMKQASREHVMGVRTSEKTTPTNSTCCCSRRQKYGKQSSDDGPGHTRILFETFADTLLSDALISNLDLESQQMTLTIREVLLSGDANRLVAELTHVHVDDVAAPLEEQDLVTKLEPLFACIIVMNGVIIGLQTAAKGGESGADPYFWANVALTVLFIGEVALRVVHTGSMRYVTGPDRWWNMFDFSLMLVSACDIILGASPIAADLTPLGVLRVARLMRVTRLFRLFRMKYMRELNLMVRGLLRGFHTLFWAVVVLFFTLFVVAVTATTAIGDATAALEDIRASGNSPQLVPQLQEVVREQLFASIPRSFFTSFRCFMGDCTTSHGYAVVQILTETYGFGFVALYMASTIFVVFGVFNLVAAVYVENTMNAAKTDGEKTKSDRHRESVRIARLTRQLLKKFCSASKLTDDPLTPEVRVAMRASAIDDVGDAHRITKEVFLCVIQDSGVQKLMDELDIPPDRAGLFDILDSDSSGSMEVAELISGLLQVRGEAKKRDVLGALLASRASQAMLRDQDSRLARLEMLMEDLHMRAQTKTEEDVNMSAQTKAEEQPVVSKAPGRRGASRRTTRTDSTPSLSL